MINRISIGNKGWEKFWRFPKVGFSFAIVDYNMHQKPNDLGYTISVAPFFHGYFFNTSKWSANYGFGFGAAFQTSFFDRIDNYENNALGSRVTAAFSTDYKINYHISHHLTAHANFSLRHYSNGAIRLPNAGINILLWGLGVSYQPNYQPRYQRPDSTWKFKKRVRVNFEFGYNRKGIIDGDFAKYGVLTFGLYASKMVSKINSLVLGVDVCHDESTFEDAVVHKVIDRSSDIRPNGLSVFASAGTELFIGRQASFTTLMGWHLYQDINVYGKFVHRHTLRWYIIDNLYIKGALKVYGFAADSFDLGLGVRI
ncbi:MAG: acyloxyacyl hydrolase [Bacteroidota bacterium]|nr:acyloxyacyl hydrolase [Bacteroidota bacterium]